MRDEPGIGAFVVALHLEPAGGASLRPLRAAEIARLRDTKAIVRDRAHAVFVLRTSMPPPTIATG